MPHPRKGVIAISAGAKEKLSKSFADDIAAGAEVMGGHQFLAEFPEIGPIALQAFNGPHITPPPSSGQHLKLEAYTPHRAK